MYGGKGKVAGCFGWCSTALYKSTFINKGLRVVRKIDYRKYGIPFYMWEGIDRYLQWGIAGDFLAAVVSNDLYGACNRADDTNKDLLWNYVNLMYNEFPSDIWGSREKFLKHQERARLNMTKPSDEVAQARSVDHPNE